MVRYLIGFKIPGGAPPFCPIFNPALGGKEYASFLSASRVIKK